MTVRCKFKVDTVNLFQGSEQVSMSAVYGGANATKENVSFADATPTGELKFTVNNKQVFGQFKPGQSYYLDLIPAE